MDKQLPATRQQLAPPGYRKISDDLWIFHNWGGAFCSWVIALFMALALLIMQEPVATFVAILFLAWPVLATFSYFDMRNLCRYMTWISENTAPVKAHVKITTIGTIRPISRAYITHDETEYWCLIAAWSDYKRMAKQIGPMDVHFIPNTDEPLVAVAGDLRIWFETSMTNLDIELPKKRKLSAKEIEDLADDFKL